MSNNIPNYRKNYRNKHITSLYNGWLHLLFTIALCIVLSWLTIHQLNNITVLEWLTIPLTFIYANLAEYLGHKGPMHRVAKGLKSVFRRHTLQHHKFFTDKVMAIDHHRDFKAVLFPPILMSFFLLAFGMPVVLLLLNIFSSNVAWLFASTGLFYFLSYELTHFIYHLPTSYKITQWPFIIKMREHHLAHHNVKLMSRYNFNITFPLGDWLFGTIYKKSVTMKNAS